MVQVTIRRDSRERLSSFFASGHAGWADAGQDVVCAAVSTLLQAAWLGLDEVAGIAVEGAREAGRLELSWPEAARSDPGVRAIVETVARSIETLAAQYPAHVKVAVAREPGP
jgi:uncharacterized protein YsxB (DUF464 family)